MKQKSVLKNLKISSDDPLPSRQIRFKFFILFYLYILLFLKVSEDQLDFIKAFNKLSEDEKAKLLESMSAEERVALFGLQDAYEK